MAVHPLFRAYNPALARQVARKARALRSYHSHDAERHPPVPRPYTFYVGASWAGKPNDPAQRAKVPFPPDTLVGQWRDKMLSHPKAAKSVDAGEDFFFIQEVMPPLLLYVLR